jgi:hypothetical protein
MGDKEIMDTLNAVFLFLAIVGIFIGAASLIYAYFCQQENKNLKAQLDEVLASVSKANIKLEDIGMELVKFKSQDNTQKFPQTQQKRRFWDNVLIILIGAVIGLLIYLIFDYLRKPRKKTGKRDTKQTNKNQ